MRLRSSLFAILFLFSSTVFAANCEDLLKTSAPWGQIKPDFQHTDHYDVELPLPFSVKDQCATSFCHLYAWSADLENQSGIETSAEYVAAVYLREVVERALLEGNLKFEGELGATAEDSLWAIRRAGLIPKEAWTGVKGFNSAQNMSRLLETLQSIIANAKSLREAANGNSERQMQINHEAYLQINDILRAFVGEVPKTFNYKGELHTPLTFAEKYFPNLFDPLVKVMVISNQQKESIGQSGYAGVEILTNMEELRRTARAILDRGQPVWLGYSHRDQFVDHKRGIMSISAFNYPPMAQADRETRLNTKIWDGGHAVLLVGYELDPVTGEVRKWKIRNSWGMKAGDEGDYHMYDDYFRDHVVSITYLNDGTAPIPSFWEKQPETGFKK
jgi:bleomycin hydrolase